MVGKRVCVRYHQAIPMGDKIAGAGSYPLDAASCATERRMIMDEVKYYPARMDYPNLCKPYSNADRIRSMSDEELKKFICSMFKCEFCDFELGERCGLLNWLQMPAEVNE